MQSMAITLDMPVIIMRRDLYFVVKDATRGRNETCAQKRPLGNLGMDVRIILKWILEK